MLVQLKHYTQTAKKYRQNRVKAQRAIYNIANASQTMKKHAKSTHSLFNKTENLTEAKNELKFTI